MNNFINKKIRVFTCIMAIYDKKDSVNTGKTKKLRWLHLIYGIRVSYFWLGKKCHLKSQAVGVSKIGVAFSYSHMPNFSCN